MPFIQFFLILNAINFFNFKSINFFNFKENTHLKIESLCFLSLSLFLFFLVSHVFAYFSKRLCNITFLTCHKCNDIAIRIVIKLHLTIRILLLTYKWEFYRVVFNTQLRILCEKRRIEKAQSNYFSILRLSQSTRNCVLKTTL